MSSFYGNVGIASGGGGGGGTSNYNELLNKPQINGVTLEGNVSSEDLGIRDGVDGADGADGVNGVDGQDGKSAYEYAVEAGYTGTEEEFSQKLARMNDCDYINVSRLVNGKSPIIINDSADTGFEDFKTFGWSKQEKTNGAQLLDLEIDKEISNNGLTCLYDKESGILTINGTTINDGNLVIKNDLNINMEDGKKYTLSMKKISGSVTIPSESNNNSPSIILHSIFSSDYSQYPNRLEQVNDIKNEEIIARVFDGFVSNTGKYIFILQCFYGGGVVFNNYKIKYMLNEGSTALPWEPYTGGKPAPNPEYPREIISAGQVKTTGAQMLDTKELKNIELNGITYEVLNDGGIHIYGKTDTYSYINPIFIVLNPGIYTSSLKNPVKGIHAYISTRKEGEIWNDKEGTVTITEEDLIIRFYIRADNNIEFDDIIYPMINKGSTALPWEPYTGGISGIGDVGIKTEITGKNLIDVNKVIFQYCTLQDSESMTIKSNINNYYFCSLYFPYSFPGKTYSFEVANNTKMITIVAWNKDDKTIEQNSSVLGKAKCTLHIPDDFGEIKRLELRMNRASNAFTDTTTIISNLMFYEGEEATPYELYKYQSLEHATTNGLPGIPVSAGGNYIDENGQQWIADYRDWERGVDVQMVKKTILAGTEQYLGDETNKGYFDGSSTNLFIHNLPNIKIATRSGNNKVDIASLCNKLIFTQNSIWTSSYAGSVGITLNVNQVHLRLANETIGVSDDATIEEKRAAFIGYITKCYEDGDPFTILYALAKPIETPIPASELAAYRIAHTNYPNTIITNSADADMSVKYIADTKTYIDNNYVLKEEHNALENRVTLLEQKVSNQDKVLQF